MTLLKYFYLIIWLIPTISFAQNILPDLKISSINGDEISISQLRNDGKPIVVSFWATWCKPCVSELNEITDVYDEWQDDMDFTFLAVSTDDARSVAKVKSMVKGKDWPFTILLDPNQELKRAMNVSTIPHIFLFDGNGKLVYQHQGYSPGNEWELFEELLKLK